MPPRTEAQIAELTRLRDETLALLDWFERREPGAIWADMRAVERPSRLGKERNRLSAVQFSPDQGELLNGAADADAMRPEHMVEFWKPLGGGQRDAGLDGSLRLRNQLAIVPNTTHYTLAVEPMLPAIVERFSKPHRRQEVVVSAAHVQRVRPTPF